MPVWAAGGADMLLSWEPPNGAKEIVVLGDNDPNFAGQAASFALAHRLAMRPDLNVRHEQPDVPGDWNDVLMERVGVPA
mgnify:CR=1 FL=1